LFKGIVFDFNGVLWWDGHLQTEAWQQFALEVRGTAFSKEELAIHMQGRTNTYVFSYLLGREVAGKELFDLIDQKESVYRGLCLEQGDRFILSPGSVNLLTYLCDRKIPHTIATASERTNLDFFVAHLSLPRWFDIHDIVYDDGVLSGKPAPDIYLQAARNLGLKPVDCIVVEDAFSGIQAAHTAGIGYIIAIGPRSSHDTLLSLDCVDEAVERLDQVRRDALFAE
jgi:beta-phosphoglucomutase-like phosphatase (HAD superfamily)